MSIQTVSEMQMHVTEIYLSSIRIGKQLHFNKHLLCVTPKCIS